MAKEDDLKAKETTEKSLSRMQKFDVSKLPRESELGINFRFTKAVEPAGRLVELFRRLPVSALDDLGRTQLDQVERQAASCYNLFDQVLKFDETQSNALTARDTLISQIEGAYQEAFNVMMPLIGYSLYKTADFQRLETDARAALQKIHDEAEVVKGELNSQKQDASQVLEEIRQVAAEQGVTQQAIYFKSEADENVRLAEEWRVRTVKIAWGLGIYSFLSIFLHKIPGLAPLSTYDAVQLATSKILIFSVISFVLFLSAKNFLSHKHNATVNRHRQNALMTYKSLVEAAGDKQQASDAILIHAAACIYSPQPTGYTGSGSDMQGAKSVVELLSKPISTASK
jgi:hypothetical protein